MNRAETDFRLLERICCGNREAMDWLANFWSPYVHGIDDIIDGEAKGPEEILSTFALAAELYAHPFYVRHMAALKQLVLVITNCYADAVRWEGHLDKWKADWADHNRHVGMEMVIAVAQLCGGYSHARMISQEQRTICWLEHHDQDGKPE